MIKKYLGIRSYNEIYNYMIDYTNNRNNLSKDQILLLEHYNVFTKGKIEKHYNNKKINGIPVIKTDRGGQITFHGPGQAIIYLLIDILRLKINIKQLVLNIENCCKQLLKIYGLKCYNIKSAPGIYYKNQKIASLGLRIKRGKTYHGIAINNNINLKPFKFIEPCGFKNLKMTSLSSYGIVLQTKQILYDYHHLFKKNIY